MTSLPRDPTQSQHARRQHVSRMRASFALEGLEPDANDLANQQMYIDGKIGLDDMLKYARNFAKSRASGNTKSP
jgi:hypothetical protein